jgi:hypothetical protein
MVILSFHKFTTNNEIELIMHWVYFSLSAPTFNNDEIYINGMFSNTVYFWIQDGL